MMRFYCITILLLWCSITISIAQTCAYSYHGRMLHGNDVRAHFSSNGRLFWNGQQAEFKVPYEVGTPMPNALFAGGLWLGVLDTATGNLQLAIQRYGTSGNDYWSGPLGANGAPIPAGCINFDYVWQVKRWQIEAHLLDFAIDGDIDGPVDEALLRWPGRGNPQFAAQMGFDLPNQDLAPFYDRNGNGIYEPLQGDYPVYDHNVATAVADDLLWWVFNDNANVHTESNAQALGAEVQASAWSFHCPNDTLINRTIFLRQRITNKSNATWRNFRAGIWTDPDLGCAIDDYTGTDTSSNTIYWYNADNLDEDSCSRGINALGFGSNPPAQALTFLNQSLNSSMYIPSGVLNTSDPFPPNRFHHLLSGRWPNGTLLTTGGNGYNPLLSNPITTYAFPTNPNQSGGWSMYGDSLPGGDIASIGAVHRDSLAVGATFVLDVAYSYHRHPNLDHLQNVNAALQDIPQIQAWYDQGFAFTNCPAPTTCTQLCVYPGDLNNNGIVSDFDLLDWGVAVGQQTTALARATPDERWLPQPPTAPVGPTAYLDANGDGAIDEADYQLNTRHWGYTHTLYTGAAEGSNAVGTDLTLGTWPFQFPLPQHTQPFPDTLFHTGARVDAYVQLGDPNQPLQGVYGLVFELAYDTAVFEGLIGPRGHWNDLPFEWIQGEKRHRRTHGRLHYTNVRTDGQGKTRSGVLGSMRLKLKATAPVLADTMRTQICFENFKLIDSTGATIPLGASCLTIEYYDSTFVPLPPPPPVTPIAGPTLPTATLYPNPSNSNTTVDVALDTVAWVHIRLFDSMNQLIYEHLEQQPPTGRYQHTVPTAGWPAGIYHCHIATDQEQHTLAFAKAQ